MYCGGIDHIFDKNNICKICKAVYDPYEELETQFIEKPRQKKGKFDDEQ